jgi:hypothetical protein
LLEGYQGHLQQQPCALKRYFFLLFAVNNEENINIFSVLS